MSVPQILPVLAQTLLVSLPLSFLFLLSQFQHVLGQTAILRGSSHLGRLESHAWRCHSTVRPREPSIRASSVTDRVEDMHETCTEILIVISLRQHRLIG